MQSQLEAALLGHTSSLVANHVEEDENNSIVQEEDTEEVEDFIDEVFALLF